MLTIITINLSDTVNTVGYLKGVLGAEL